jgi:hypothetical protein
MTCWIGVKYRPKGPLGFGRWNALEATLLEAHGFERVGMGARTLRTDTGCVLLLALVHDAMGVCGAQD